jgi:hypothetical protein
LRGSTATLNAPTLIELKNMLFGLRFMKAGQMSERLRRELQQNLEWQIAQIEWTMSRVHFVRWYAVREAVERGNKLLSADFQESAFRVAAEILVGTPASGSAASMKASYYQFDQLWRTGQVEGPPGTGMTPPAA